MASFSYYVCRTAVWTYTKVFYRHRVYGKKNIPKGGAIIAPNHVSHLDPMLIATSWVGEVNFVARETLFDGPILGWLLPRINVQPISRGEADIVSMKKILRLLKEGRKVVLFPEGTRSRNGQPAEGQLGVGFLAHRANVPIIPVYLKGTYDAMPAGARPRPFGRTSCHIGVPIYPDPTLDKREAQQAMVDQTMAAIADMRSQSH